MHVFELQPRTIISPFYKPLCHRPSILQTAEGKSCLCGWMCFFPLATIDQNARSDEKCPLYISYRFQSYYFFSVYRAPILPSRVVQPSVSARGAGRRVKWMTNEIRRNSKRDHLCVIYYSIWSVHPIAPHICIYFISHLYYLNLSFRIRMGADVHNKNWSAAIFGNSSALWSEDVFLLLPNKHKPHVTCGCRFT